MRAQFKLDQIKDMESLHQYKNLLNAMAALFYTNHRMGDVSSMFAEWRQLTQQKQAEQPVRRSSPHRIEPELTDDQIMQQDKPQVEHRFSIDYDAMDA